MDYSTHAENGFASLDKAELRQACKTLGVTIGGNESDDSMRRKLCAAYGVAAPDVGSSVPVAPAKKAGGMPNLDPNAGEGWGGKWYFVKVGTSNPILNSCPVGWNGDQRNLPLNERVRIIAPHYHALMESVGEKITQRGYKDEQGLQKYERVSRPFSEFFVMEATVDPETAHLPRDYIDYFTGIEKRNPGLKGLSRAQLGFMAMKMEIEIRTHESLRVINAADIKEMSDDDLRHLICLKLVPGYGLDIFDGVEAA